ncbi:MAG: FtsW/RodA/SpoVE family cell cycle protein, partial [Bradymonadaceae bacterium]
MSLTTLSSLGADDSDAVAAQSPGGGGTDLILLAAVVGLLGLGAVMLYSASAVMASKELGGHFELVAQHLIRIAAGLVVMIGAMQVHYQWYRRLVYPILGLAVLGLVLVFVPGVGVTRNAARRWISL